MGQGRASSCTIGNRENKVGNTNHLLCSKATILKSLEFWGNFKDLLPGTEESSLYEPWHAHKRNTFPTLVCLFSFVILEFGLVCIFLVWALTLLHSRFFLVNYSLWLYLKEFLCFLRSPCDWGTLEAHFLSIYIWGLVDYFKNGWVSNYSSWFHCQHDFLTHPGFW